MYILRTLLTVLTILSVNSLTRAQTLLKGLVLNELNKPVSNASVTVKDNEGLLLFKTQSDSIGTFKISKSMGFPYQIVLSKLGYRDTEREITIADTSNSIIPFIIFSSSISLDEVIINRKKPLVEHKIDRYIFNVSNSITTIGGDGLDALKSTPGLNVYNGAVKIVGKSGVKVLIDGRESHLSGGDLNSYLQSIPANVIDRIEVLTTPPAEFSAQGNSGVINIVLKKDRPMDLMLGNIGASIQQSNKTSKSVFANLSYNKGKLKTSFNGSIADSRGGEYFHSDIYYPETFQATENSINSKSKPYAFNVAGSYDFSPKTEVGVKVDLRNSSNDMSRNDLSLFSNYQHTDSSLVTDVLENSNWKGNLFAAFFGQKLDTMGSTLTADVTFYDYAKERNYMFNSRSFDSYMNLINNYQTISSDGDLDIKLYSAKIKYDEKFKIGTLSAGAEYSKSTTKNNFTYNIKNDDTYMDSYFKYRESIYAGYVTFNSRLSESLEIQAGLRSEYISFKSASITQNKYNNDNYLKFFPTIYLQYNLNDKNSITATYGRRIDRPNFKQLDPFVEYTSPLSYAMGNPNLRPYFTDNIELKYNNNSIFSTTIYASFSKNMFNYINIADPETFKVALISENYLSGNNYGLIENISLSPISFWESNSTIQVFYSSYSSKNLNTLSSLNGYGTYFTTNNNFTLNKAKTMAGNMNFRYQGPEVYGVDKYGSRYSLDLGVSAKLFKEKLTVSASAADLLKTYKMRINSVVNNISQHYDQYSDTRRVRFTVSYKFGTGKNFQSKVKNDENLIRID